jgi:hypothetical protein
VNAPTTSLARRILNVAERLAVAHFVGYPIAFLWAVAAIPLTIHLNAAAIDQIGGEMDRVGQFVVRRLAWPAGVAFALAHATAVPWIAASDAKRGQRISLLCLAALAVLGVIAGGASWLWLILR